MSPKALRPAAAALLVTAVALTLSGCASWGLSQRGWANALEQRDGVVSVDWSYHNNWPSSGVRYDSTIVVSPDVTEQQARAIAQESCAHDTRITRIDMRTTADYSDEGGVEQLGLSEGPCIDADALAQFSRASAAMNALLPGFDGGILLGGLLGPDEIAAAGADTGLDAGSYLVTVAATEDTMLLDALRELHKRFDDTPLAFEGNTSETGSTITMFGSPLRAELSPKADFARLEPLIEQALKLDRRAITVTDDSVLVNLGSTDALGSAELQEFTRLAAELGVDGRAVFAPLARPDTDAGTDTNSDTGTPTPDPAEDARQAALFAAIVAIPGGASAVAPEPPAGDAITVYPNEAGGVEATAQLLAQAPEYASLFRINAPDPGLFWVDMRPGGQDPQHVGEVFAATQRVRAGLTGLDRVILRISPADTELTVILTDSAGAPEQAQARALLTELARGNTFDEVRLSGPGITSTDEVIG